MLLGAGSTLLKMSLNTAIVASNQKPAKARRWSRMLVVLVACCELLLCPESVSAVDFSTINVETLNGFFAIAEQTQRPVTVVSFGDSMANSYRSVSQNIMAKLEAKIGVAGYTLNNYLNTGLYVVTNGSYEVMTGPLWFSQYFALPEGSSLWWNNQLNAGGIFCDKVGVFYVAQPLGGQMRLSVSTNGGPWITKTLLDGYNATPVGRYIDVQLKANNYRVRLEPVMHFG